MGSLGIGWGIGAGPAYDQAVGGTKSADDYASSYQRLAPPLESARPRVLARKFGRKSVHTNVFPPRRFNVRVPVGLAKPKGQAQNR